MNDFNTNGGTSEMLDKLKTKRPKKALSAYMIFVQENRSIISENNQDLTALDVMKQVGLRWQTLHKSEKSIYDSKASDDKNRFQRELNKFEKEIEDMNTASPKKSMKVDKALIRNKPVKGRHTYFYLI